MDTPKKEGVPKVIFAIIVVVFVLMYYYAAFGPVTGPEKKIEKFYAAYINKDFQGMAENLSVFWSVQYLPQYSELKPSELMAQREEIEKETAVFLAGGESQTQTDLRVDALPEYTVEGVNCAMVVYAGSLGDQELGREVAILLRENEEFYLYMWMPMDSDALYEELKANFEKFDADYTRVLADDEW